MTVHVSPAGLLLPGATQLVPARAMPKGILSPMIKANEADPKEMLRKVAADFAAYREENDKQLAAAGKAIDVLEKEKLARIDTAIDNAQAAIDGMNARLEALQAGGAREPGPGNTPEDREYAKQFKNYFMKGDDHAAVVAAQRTGIRAAMSVGSGPDGGLLAPVEWDRTITDKLKLISPIRQLAGNQQISTPGFTKIYNDRAVGSGWVGETASRPNTSTPQFSALTYSVGEIYANPAASQQLLDDALVNIEQWLGGEVETEFARQEGIAFISGNGVNKPYGLLGYATGGAFASQHPFGAIKVVNSGNASALTLDGIIDMVYDLPTAFTGNARFACNRRSMRAIRKFKDQGGQYLWQPSMVEGAPATVLGFGVAEIPDMPDIAANALPIAFGDFARTYLVIDRIGIRVLRDPYTNKPYVSFYTTKRVGGAVVNPEPMRFQLIAA